MRSLSKIVLRAQLILGEGGEFQKQSDSAGAFNGVSTTANEPSRGGAPPRPRPSTNGGGLPAPLTVSAPNAVSKRVNYPYADGSGGSTAKASGGGGGGGGGGEPGGRSLKRVASTRIAAKATVSNAFRR